MASIDPAVLRRYKRKRLLRGLLTVIIMSAATLALIEFLLRLTDPFGAVYFHDLSANFFEIAIEDPRGYVVPAGEYHASHWSFTILPDHTRAVPDNDSDAEKTMVFIGDSVTFGYGVEDAETFVNLVARAFPDWRVINESYPGWGIVNLENALVMHPDADLIFVFTISNDLSEPYLKAGARAGREPYIQLYATLLGWMIGGYPFPSEAQLAQFEPTWTESITHIGADPRVTFLTTDTTNDYEQRVLSMFPDSTVILQNYTGLVSTVDSHPNAESHGFLAEQIVPVVAEAIELLDAE